MSDYRHGAPPNGRRRGSLRLRAGGGGVIVLVLLSLCLGCRSVSAERPPPGVKLRMSEALFTVRPPAEDAGEVGDEAPPPYLFSFRGAVLRGLELKLSAASGYENNVTRTVDDRQRSLFARLTPEAALVGKFRKHRLGLNYRGEIGRFTKVPDENYFDHGLAGDIRLDLTRKLNVNVEGKLDFGHDTQRDTRSAECRGDIRLSGRCFSTVLAGKQNKWWRPGILGEIEYGRRITQAQLVASVDHARLRYFDDSEAFRELDRLTLQGTGYWNLHPRFSPLVQLTRSYSDYLNPGDSAIVAQGAGGGRVGNGDIDSVDTTYGLGWRWEATAKTSGNAKFGITETDLDDPALEGKGSFFWDGVVQWRPKAYSVVAFKTSMSRQEIEMPLVGGSSESQHSRYGVGWRHGLSRKLEFKLDASLDLSETTLKGVSLVDPAGSGLALPSTSDSLFSFGFDVYYRFTDWLVANLGFKHVNGNDDYIDNSYTVSLSANHEMGRPW